MAITLTKLEIRNFRSCTSVALELDRYTALVGYNNCGKSNILSAIQWLLRRSSLLASDFFDPNTPVEIVGEFSNISQEDINLLSDNAQRQIHPFISQGTIKVRRTQEAPGARATDIRFEVFDAATPGGWRNNPTGIDNALAVMLPEPIRIGAMEDAAEDSAKAKTTTTIGKLLGELTSQIQAATTSTLSSQINALSDSLASQGQNRLPVLSSLDSAINTKLSSMFPGIGVKLHFEVPTIADLVKSGTLKVTEDGGKERDITSYGHGTQRSIQMTLIRHLAEIKRGRTSGGTTLLLVDEPELYLHPYAIEQVRLALKTLAASDYQVIFSTHSAQLVGIDDAQHAVLVRKDGVKGTTARMRLADALNKAIGNSTHQAEHLFALSNSNQFLFADRAVIVEGKTERKLLPHIYSSVKQCTLGLARIALIPVDGVQNVGKTLEILRAMDIPAKAIVDLDYAFQGAINDGYIQDGDSDLSSLLAILKALEAAGLVTLGTNGRPMKSGNQKASDTYALLALEPSASSHILALHTRLKQEGIWLWTKGAIEPHLGLVAKSEHEWASYKTDLAAQGFAARCSNDQFALELIDWL